MASVDVGNANGSSLHHHDFKLARQQVQNGLDPCLATSWKSNTLMASAALAMASGAYGSVGFCARIVGAAQTAGLLARKRRKALLEASTEAASVVIFYSRDYAGGPGGNRACRAVPVSACKRSGPEIRFSVGQLLNFLFIVPDDVPYYMANRGGGMKSDMWVRRTLVVVAGIVMAGCASTPPANPADVCEIFVEKRSWYRDARRASERWQVPISVLMSFTYQESSFRARARPPRRRLLGFIPWTRTADAFGFAQATDAAWSDYTSDTGRRGASRSNFGDAVDFVGWYNDLSFRRNQIDKTDAYRLYLAYHEGHGGYSRQTYSDKAWLLDAARNVASRSDTYDSQLQGCQRRLQRHWWWPF